MPLLLLFVAWSQFELLTRLVKQSVSRDIVLCWDEKNNGGSSSCPCLGFHHPSYRDQSNWSPLLNPSRPSSFPHHFSRRNQSHDSPQLPSVLLGQQLRTSCPGTSSGEWQFKGGGGGDLFSVNAIYQAHALAGAFTAKIQLITNPFLSFPLSLDVGLVFCGRKLYDRSVLRVLCCPRECGPRVPPPQLQFGSI